MLFTSQLFVFYFLPLALLGYYLLPVPRNLFLLLLGYIFYGWWNPGYTLLLLTVTLVNYAGGQTIARNSANERRRFRALVLTLCLSLGILGFFKYFTFFEQNVNAILHGLGMQPLPVLKIPLPVGISFYIFLSISYPISLYIEESPAARSFTDFACYVSLFPLVISGPIVRYKQIVDQLSQRTHSLDKFASGVSLFILGFAKKIFLANGIAKTADAVFAAESLGALDAWFGILAYTMQIYFDFSGYSDVAIGLGRMFGFEFTRNFNAPYLADSITDFWRRWHISLSTMLRDYVYVPLIAVGRNRNPKFLIYRNLILTMLICGLWHGATWTFILWGGLHGILLAFEQWRGKKGVYARLPQAARIGITFLTILFSWVLFRSPTLSDAARYFSAMLGLVGASGGSVLLNGVIYTQGNLLIAVLCVLLVFQPRQAFEWSEKITVFKAALLIVLFGFSLAGMFAQSFSPFLYSQF